jgi:hypothetical protein
MGHDLTGEWNGSYAYSVPGPGDPGSTTIEIEDMSRRNPVSFVMSLREGFWFSIGGTVNDVGPGAVKGGHLDGREKGKLHVLVEAAEGTIVQLSIPTQREDQTQCAVTVH